MPYEALGLPGLFVVRPDVTREPHGRFTYHYSRQDLQAHGLAGDYVQEHASRYPALHTVRGLHYQAPPRAQVKVVRVSRGRIHDVVVDIRHGSPTFGRHASIELSAEEWTQLYVPPGFAHGFCTLEPDTEVVFRLTDYNVRDHLAGLQWNDPALAIDWPCADSPGYVFPFDRDLPRLGGLPRHFVYDGAGGVGEGGVPCPHP